MKKTLWIVLLSLALSPLFGPAVAQDELLEPDKAYAFSAKVEDSETVTAQWNVAKGYYLYRNKISFSSDTPGVAIGNYELPKGKTKQDEFFGEIEVYQKKIAIAVPIIRENPDIREFTLVAKSQGCAEIGVCYPPHKQKVTLSLPAMTAAASSATAKPSALESLASLGDSLGMGDGMDDILDPDVAFRFSHKLLDANTLQLSWNIAPDHYLYRDKVKIKIKEGQDVELGNIQLPAGESKKDEFFGVIDVYHDQIEVKVPLLRQVQVASDLVLHVEYQGCAEKTGICYPPIKKDLDLNLPYTQQLASSDNVGSAMAASTTTPSSSNGQDDYLGELQSSSLFMSLLLLFGWGLIVAFTACMYPMIPILSSIIVGQGEKATFARSFGLSLVYVEGMALTFAIMGAIMGAIGEGIGIQAYFQSPWLLLPFAFIFVLLAFALFGFFNVQMPAAIQSRLNEMSNRQQSGNLLGVAIMGILSGLIIGPCGGPFLIAALGYAAGSGDALLGFLYLFLFGNGIGLPLLIVGASGGALLPKAGDWMNVVKATGGVLLLGVVIVLLERMPHLFSPTLTMMLWAILFIVASIYMGAMQTLESGASGWRKFWKGLGTVVFIYGVLVMLGGLTGASDVTRPLHGSQLTAKVVGSAGHSEASEIVHFKRIKSKAELDKELAQAKAKGKPVILDFYADWCTYCVEYERYVFPQANVQAQLKKFVLLQADVTAMDDTDKDLMKGTRVLLPPAILFYGLNSEELRPQRIVGAMKANEFEQHLQQVLSSL